MRTITAFTIFWIPMIPIAILNGLLRVLLFQPYMNELAAHQLSTLTCILFLAVYTHFLIKRFKPTDFQSLSGGLVWMILTILFEFSFGHFIAGHSWELILNDYNIFKGRIWVFIPVSLAIMPLIMNKINFLKN
ncbi:hypothetical protein [Maridesulfovibrio bastinii]|uniref:hypothetical protein n=1 Tax=Maridesulfovibrio bastinii TaxID=47157 RepID=UPI00041340B4|nr:hypothetical protein [Maridesulfovibrio bastinii]